MLGQHAEIGRQPGLQPGLDLARQHGGSTLRADRHRHRGAVDDRRHNEGGELRRVDNVDGNAARLGRAGDAGVELAVAGGGIDEALSLEVAGEEHAQHDPDGVGLLQLAQLVGDSFGDDRDMGAGLQQEAHLLRRLLAAADHQHVRLVEVGKEGKVLHAPQAPARVTSKPSRCLSQIS
jgi:hypothetical protein